MIFVEISLRTWQKVFPTHTQFNGEHLVQNLSNGLVIESDQVVMPWERGGSAHDVVIGIRTEQDAAWFVLSYGGTILQ